jgi:hypothetical protein
VGNQKSEVKRKWIGDWLVFIRMKRGSVAFCCTCFDRMCLHMGNSWCDGLVCKVEKGDSESLNGVTLC